ncbi:hypothetical protein O181_027023 [Austropuccinia psidii MF-1]|uniref:Uncharacterized protein n=1 Tax=Austropuccinia psidii MF-1 TaxID=1389203 RepID=A0A9Q3CNP9_9BASI|nr:hypothetical protein [Austropuccinia psidii MF-1]
MYKIVKGDKRHQREPGYPTSEASDARKAPKLGSMADIGPISKLKPFGNLVTTPGKILHQLLVIDFMSSRIKVKLTSHSGLTPNPVTSTNIGSPVPSTEIPHHWILPQPSESW